VATLPLQCIRSLTWGFTQRELTRRWIMALQTVVDDSGRGNPPVFVLAGFAAKVERWVGFPEDWQAVLDIPPKLAYFKMKEAHSLKRQFYGFTEKQRDERLEAFVEVIERYVDFSFRLVIPHDLYRAGFQGKITRETDQPYFIAYYYLMTFLTAREYNKPDGDKMDFVFDEQSKEQNWALDAYSLFVRFVPQRLKHLIGERPIHRDEKVFLPLQAADLYAWHVRKFYAERAANRRFNNPVWKRLSLIHCEDEELTVDRINSLVSNMAKIKISENMVFPYDLERNLPPKLRAKVLKELRRLRAQRGASEREP
jgi:hypothetical protein